MEVPDKFLDKDKYREAFKQAEEKYDRPSAYRSMYMAKVYKKLGGRYKEEDKSKPRTNTWLEEEWVQIKPYIKENKKVKCGANEDKPKACRPLKNVKGGDDNITMSEIIKKYGKKKVLALTEQKIKDMDGRLDWKKGTFTPSGERPRDKD